MDPETVLRIKRLLVEGSLSSPGTDLPVGEYTVHHGAGFKIHPASDQSKAATETRAHRISATVKAYLDFRTKQHSEAGVIEHIGRDRLLQYNEDMLADDAKLMQAAFDKNEVEHKKYHLGFARLEKLKIERKKAAQELDVLLATARGRASEIGCTCKTLEDASAFYHKATDQIWGPELFVDLRKAIHKEAALEKQTEEEMMKCIMIILKAHALDCDEYRCHIKHAASEFADDLLALCPDKPQPDYFKAACAICPNDATQVWIYTRMKADSLPGQRLYAVCQDKKCQAVLTAMSCTLLTRLVVEEKKDDSFHHRVAREIKKRLGVDCPLSNFAGGIEMDVPLVAGKTREEVRQIVLDIIAEEESKASASR